MFYLEKLENPFSEFYMESFSCIKEEQIFKDALKYQYNNQSLTNKRLESFGFHEYSFLTFLIKNENNTWLGYINLYNDVFIKNQIDKLIKLSLNIIEKIKNKYKDNLILFYEQKLKERKCRPYDIENIIKLIFENYISYGGSKKQLNNYILNCQKILEERPEELFIEFAVYDWLNISIEVIDSLLNELYQLLENDINYQNCIIILKSNKNDIILNKNNYNFYEKDNFSYYYLKNYEKSNIYKKCLYMPKN